MLEVIDLRSRGARRTPTDATRPLLFDDEQPRAHIVLRGAGTYEPTHGAPSRTLLAGDMLLLNTPVPHRLSAAAARNTPRPEAVWLTIEFNLDRSSPHPLSAQLPNELLLRAEEVTDHAELLRMLDLVETELVNRQPGEQFIALRLSEAAVVAALRRYQRLSEAEDGFLAALSDAPTCRALAAIHADPARRWRLEDLAGAAALSVGTFGERFHRLVGEPPMRYVRVWRLLTARRLIAATPYPISRVARQAGYRSPGGFARAFRKQFGTSPSSLRRGR